MRKYRNLGLRILYLILLLLFLLTSFWTSMVVPLRRSSGIPGCIKAVTILCHSWYHFYRKHAPNWKNLVSVPLESLC